MGTDHASNFHLQNQQQLDKTILQSQVQKEQPMYLHVQDLHHGSTL